MSDHQRHGRTGQSSGAIEDPIRAFLVTCPEPEPADPAALDHRLLAGFDQLRLESRRDVPQKEQADRPHLSVISGGAPQAGSSPAARLRGWLPWKPSLAGLAMAASVGAISLAMIAGLPVSDQPDWMKGSVVASWVASEDAAFSEADLSEVDPLALMAFDLL